MKSVHDAINVWDKKSFMNTRPKTSQKRRYCITLRTSFLLQGYASLAQHLSIREIREVLDQSVHLYGNEKWNEFGKGHHAALVFISDDPKIVRRQFLARLQTTLTTREAVSQGRNYVQQTGFSCWVSTCCWPIVLIKNQKALAPGCGTDLLTSFTPRRCLHALVLLVGLSRSFSTPTSQASCQAFWCARTVPWRGHEESPWTTQ